MNQVLSLIENTCSVEINHSEENSRENHRNTINPINSKTSPEYRIKEIKLAIKNLKKNNKEYSKMNKELNSFSYISSHDLQEPLRKIQTFSSRIMEKEYVNLSESGKDYLSRMQNAAKRMQILIEDLISYSKLDSSEKAFQKVDLNTIIEKVQRDLKKTIEEKKAIIDSGPLCELNAIPYQFRQLINNILSNSLKFSDPARQLLITVKTKIINRNQLNFKKNASVKNYCHINISDTGIGFEPRYSKRIFEVFQRLNGRDEYEGTGIGLAICKKIVENHNGVITATAQLNVGASFDIYIPAD